jgi:hypothetical protein
MKGFILFTTLIIFFSCRKEERPISPNAPGDILTNTAELSSDYRYQLYFNLENNEFVGQNLKTEWDIGFATEYNGFNIKLNAANAMSAANMGPIDFNSITDTTGFKANEAFDAVTGHLDSTAIGDWREHEDVYIINRGFSFTGEHRGYVKLQILSVNANAYTFRLANLNQAEGTLYEIQKEGNYNFSFFSIDDLAQLKIEPPKTEWDIVFTQYTHIFYEPFTPYLVTGTQANTYQTKSLLIEEKPFDEIDLQFAMEQELSENINEIGYDWKSFIDGNYIIHSEKSYLIQDQKGLYYKLRFIDFYDENGQRGAPKWEFVQL